jgi:serine/threonine-protein phosphatase 2A regulatory subunit B
MFMAGTRKIVTRDLISIKIWDMCNDKKPIACFPVDENIKSHLCDLFETDSLDDRFNLSNANGSILTGNYGDSFHLIEAESGKNMQYELDYAQNTWMREVGSRSEHKNIFNCRDKVLNHDFNKATGQLAVSTHNCFFIYSRDV